jgi:hypothetical protein
LQYFLPVDSNDTTKLSEKVTLILEQHDVSGRKIDVLKVEDNFEFYSGLRCRVKVIER